MLSFVCAFGRSAQSFAVLGLFFCGAQLKVATCATISQSRVDQWPVTRQSATRTGVEARNQAVQEGAPPHRRSHSAAPHTPGGEAEASADTSVPASHSQCPSHAAAAHGLVRSFTNRPSFSPALVSSAPHRQASTRTLEPPRCQSSLVTLLASARSRWARWAPLPTDAHSAGPRIAVRSTGTGPDDGVSRREAVPLCGIASRTHPPA